MLREVPQRKNIEWQIDFKIADARSELLIGFKIRIIYVIVVNVIRYFACYCV